MDQCPQGHLRKDRRRQPDPRQVSPAVAAGIGLRAPHHEALLAQRPVVGWLEAHAENYFPQGGAQPAILERLRADYPLALHGVGLGLGSTTPLDLAHVARLRQLIARFEPMLVSEHLCWGAVDDGHLNDLLPLPYTEEALRHVVARVDELQQRLQRRVLVENLSSYLQFAESTLDEWEFLAALAERSGCGLLLDVNNVYVSACNHGFDAHHFIASLPAAAIGEIHLAGHDVERLDGREIRIDTHAHEVCDEVWSLYRFALEHVGQVPTLIEWDTKLPPLEVLVAEALRADAVARSARASVA
ncbi:MAG: DUF692 domain-containing protein [Sinobacteraceae bacterium]|nr:DUF692 domain-containing protein [Nevskiaceae bacterium]